MQILLNHTSDTALKLTIVADAKELEPLKAQVLERFQTRVKVPGFREGKTPLALLEKHVSPATLQSEFLEEAVNQMYVLAISEKRLRPIDNPQINLKKFVPFNTLEFEANLEVIGDIRLPDYKKVKKSEAAVVVTADDVKGVIKTLQERIADKKDVDRATGAGDVAWIDFKGTDHKGQPIAGAEGKDYPLTLGSNAFIPGFEDNLLGVRAGEEKTFTLKFPNDYGVAALAGQNVTFTVNVTKVQEASLPKVDDDFAAKAGPFKTLAELKTDIKRQLKTEREAEMDRQFENELVQQLAAKTEVAIPQSLVDEQIRRIEQEERQNLTYRGQTWQEHLESEGVTEEQHFEQKRPAAIERVKASLMLAEIAEAEKLDVSSEEVELRVQLLKGQYKDATMQAELAKPETRRDIASRILTEKTIAKLVSYATAKVGK